MDDFIFRENMRHFHELLAREQNPGKRAILQQLIRDEEQKRQERYTLRGTDPKAPPR